jgi:hypothetical protein
MDEWQTFKRKDRMKYKRKEFGRRWREETRKERYV